MRIIEILKLWAKLTEEEKQQILKILIDKEKNKGE